MFRSYLPAKVDKKSIAAQKRAEELEEDMRYFGLSPDTKVVPSQTPEPH